MSLVAGFILSRLEKSNVMCGVYCSLVSSSSYRRDVVVDMSAVRDDVLLGIPLAKYVNGRNSYSFPRQILQSGRLDFDDSLFGYCSYYI